MREMVRQVDCRNLLQTLRIQDDLRASLSLFAPRSCASPKHAAHYGCSSQIELTHRYHCELEDTSAIMKTLCLHTPVKKLSSMKQTIAQFSKCLVLKQTTMQKV